MKEQMQSTIKLLIVVFLINISLKGQTINQTYELAMKEYNLGNYQYANELLLRVSYFDSLKQFVVPSNLVMGNIAQNNKHPFLALNHYKQALRYNTDSATKPFLVYRIISCYTQLNDFRSVKEFLNFSCLDTNETAYLAIKCLAMLAEADYANSKIYYRKAFGNIPLSVMSEFQKLERLKNKKIGKAKNLNAVFPGLGMAYLGSRKDAINSPVLLASLTAIFAYYGNIYGWLNSFVSFSPWLSRYYVGGITRLESLKIDLMQDHQNKIIYNVVSSYPNNNKIKLLLNSKE